jgi:periplasmic protein TonB
MSGKIPIELNSVSARLSEFHSARESAHTPASSRATAGLLTALLYVLFALLMWWSLTTPSRSPAAPEITATLLPDMPKKRAIERLPPFLVHLIRPHAEMPAPPVFTIASGAPPQAPAPLSASAAKFSPIQGGTAGTGPIGQAASGNGTGGNGAGLAGCIDPVWMKAVTDRVRQFFYYPDAALALHTIGVVQMRFIVRRNGQLDKLVIAKSSGDDALDKAAYDIMHKAQPLPPIPDHMHVDRVDGELPINFGVRSFNGSTTIGHCY